MNSDTPGKKNNSTPLRKNNKRRSSSGCFAPFKSPGSAKKPSKPTCLATDKVSLAHDVVRLNKEIREKDKEIQELSNEYCEEELQIHIDKLHEYNEIKDVAQMLIGKLAQRRSTTTKALYSHFDLGLED